MRALNVMRKNLMLMIVAALAVPALGACETPREEAVEQQEDMVEDRVDQQERGLEQEYESEREGLQRQEEQLDQRIEDEGPLPPSEIQRETGEMDEPTLQQP